MNYYNPYLFNMPTNFTIPRTSGGILNRIFGSTGLRLSSILNGTQRVLNFTNQLIPVVKQVSPMFKNAKTMFKVMNEFKKTDTFSNSSNKTNNNKDNQENNNTTNNHNYHNQGPTFFM